MIWMYIYCKYFTFYALVVRDDDPKAAIYKQFNESQRK